MTTTTYIDRAATGRTSLSSRARTIAAGLLAVALVGCSEKSLNITNPNAITPEAAAGDPQALQLLATGLIIDYRGGRGGYISDAGRFGRESYIYTPQEGRNTTHYLIGVAGANKIDPTGFAVGSWGTQYNAMRDNYNFRNAVSKSSLTAAQKAAALGFAKVLQAAELLEVIATRDTLGAIVDVKDDAAELAPFVSRDSVYKFILATLDSGIAALGAGGTAFPFTLSNGYAGFNTPATFATFAQGLRARAAVYYATSGGPASAWQTALSALGASFLNAGATTKAAFDVGVYHVYGPSPDAPNPLNMVNNTDLYAHMSFQTDAQLKADGSPDNRYLAKIRTGLPSRQGPVTGSGPTSAASTLGFSIWATNASSIAVMRNEELILLRAEAKLATGDKSGAIADLNVVRVNSGGLPPSSLTAASSNDQILTGILYEKRYSLMMEGHRWVDMRRYGKLNLLPLDVSSGANANFVAKVQPIPQAECLVRAGKSGALVGPSGQNNCS
ncbi:MAG: RagB/SusD family nutrient uptake outer membrane protein [Gemmatimonadetes bacterium]|nr:RagB/SusD family nutrient uptake outer membrane protein [Gemmatimonadota bacterium]